MPAFVFLLRNNAHGAAMMLSSGESGAADQRDAVAQLGGDVRVHVATSGRFDAVLIVDFPSEAAALAFSLATTASGQYAEMLTAYEPSTVQDASLAAAKLAEQQLEHIAESVRTRHEGSSS